MTRRLSGPSKLPCFGDRAYNLVGDGYTYRILQGREDPWVRDPFRDAKPRLGTHKPQAFIGNKQTEDQPSGRGLNINSTPRNGVMQNDRGNFNFLGQERTPDTRLGDLSQRRELCSWGPVCQSARTPSHGGVTANYGSLEKDTGGVTHRMA